MPLASAALNLDRKHAFSRYHTRLCSRLAGGVRSWGHARRPLSRALEEGNANWTIANIPPQGGRKHPEQSYIQIDTSEILFICGGTFIGLDNIIKKRLGKKMIGFGSELGQQEDAAESKDILEYVVPEDVIEYGMIPEMVGRLPVITTLAPLDEDALVDILTKPQNALCRQYQRFFEMEKAELEFTEGGLRAIAQKALKRDTGARALRAITEELMIDLTYTLPEEAKGARYVITTDIVNGKAEICSARQTVKKESA